MTVVLVAEDDEDIATLLGRLLRRAGLTVERAADGAAAFEMVVAGQPDVVLTDLGMPRLDGWELLRAIRGHPAVHDIPVAILSGQLLPGDPRVTTSGACALLYKPCSTETVLTTVSQLAALGRHSHDSKSADCLKLNLVPV